MMIQWICIGKEQLRKMKLYPPDQGTMDDVAHDEGPFQGKSYRQLREKSHNWEEVHSSVEYENVLGFSEDDHEAVGESIYKSILAVLQFLKSFRLKKNQLRSLQRPKRTDGRENIPNNKQQQLQF